MKLPILNRRHRGDSPTHADGGRYALTAEIPGADPAKPFWRLKVELASSPQGGGERLRLRAHLQANFASSMAALSAPVQERPPAPGAGRLPAQRAARWLQRALENPLLQRMAEPLLRHDFNSWLEVRASTADLAFGAGALLPETERLKSLGIEPSSDGPVTQSWAGSGPHAGFAQVSLLRLDKRHLPQRLAALLGARPFHFAAALVNVIEEEEPPSR